MMHILKALNYQIENINQGMNRHMILIDDYCDLNKEIQESFTKLTQTEAAGMVKLKLDPCPHDHDITLIKALAEISKHSEWKHHIVLDIENKKKKLLEALSEAIKSGAFPKGIIFTLNNLSNEGAETLASAIKSDKCTKCLDISIVHSNISNIALSKLIAARSTHYPAEKYEFSISKNEVSIILGSERPSPFKFPLSHFIPEGLVSRYRSFLTPPYFRLDYFHVTNPGLETTALTKCLAGIKHHENLGINARNFLNVEKNGYPNDDVKLLVNAYKSLSSLTHLSLDLRRNSFDFDKTQYIASAIASLNNLKTLNLNLSGNNFDTMTLDVIVQNISSLSFLKNVNLNLSSCNIDDTGLILLTNTLASNNYLPSINLTLDLSFNKITGKAVSYIAEAISSGKTRENLTLKLGYNKFNYKSNEKLKTALTSKHCPYHTMIQTPSKTIDFDKLSAANDKRICCVKTLAIATLFGTYKTTSSKNSKSKDNRAYSSFILHNKAITIFDAIAKFIPGDITADDVYKNLKRIKIKKLIDDVSKIYNSVLTKTVRERKQAIEASAQEKIPKTTKQALSDLGIFSEVLTQGWKSVEDKLTNNLPLTSKKFISSPDG